MTIEAIMQPNELSTLPRGMRESTGEIVAFEVGIGAGGVLGMILKETTGREHWLKASPALCEVAVLRLTRALDALRGAGVTWAPDEAELNRQVRTPIDQCLRVVNAMATKGA